MLHLVFCFSVWIFISTLLFWRSLAVSQQAINHLKRLHQVPCTNCAYFTGDYRLKCTVNPMIAMSETAIGCRDFLDREGTRHNHNPQNTCAGCSAVKNCSSIKIPEKILSL